MTAAVPAPAKFAKLRALPLGAARWTGGFWAGRFGVCRERTIPSMRRLMCDDERPRFLGNFEVAAGLVEGRHRGPKWNDGDFYKWLEAAATMLAFERDEQLDGDLDQIIALIAGTQEPDGYIHTDVQIARRNGAAEAKRFGDPMDFDMYNMGHLITAGCAHHAATGKTNLLAVARRAANFLLREFASPTPQQARHGICPSHLMGLIELYRATGDARYRDLAAKLLDMRELVSGGDDDNQDRVPLRHETRAVGHAVRGTYLWAGAADVYAETGDVSLLGPLQSIWRDLVSHKLYITGGCGALFDGASPDGAADQRSITRVHQAFGRNYQLPNSTAHNETCAAIGSLLWNWRMFLVTGDARYADLVELTLLNSVLAGASLDGESYFYTNTLRQLDPMPVELRWSRYRQRTLGCFCCPPNVARTIAQSSRYAYALDERGVFVALYGSSTLQTPELRLRQETNYPWDGRIWLTIEAAPRDEMSLRLRIPGWCEGANVCVNRTTVMQHLQRASFCEIHRRWTAGDVVELDLPMPVRLVESHPLIEETRNHLAVMRGPIVYCLESVDLPADVRLLDVHVPREQTFTLRPSDQLGGAFMLEGNGVVHPAGTWGGELYRDATPRESREIPLRLIPYFAWDNRGPSEMSVWLPEAC